MKTSRNLTRLFVALAALIALCAVSFAQVDSSVQLSDQKVGTVLVFPFYGSDGAGGDTRLTITNVGPAGVATNPATARAISNALNVHLFFLDASCNQADVYLCFTKFQSYSFKASEWDPVTTRGELIAIPVDNMGYPISYNGLIGNAFVNTTVGGNKWIGNYSPEALASIGVPDINGNFQIDPISFIAGATTANLPLNNGPKLLTFGLDAPADKFAAELQSPKDVANQAILTMGLNGTIGGPLSGNAAAGTGVIYRNDEKAFSFTPPAGGCSVVTLINDASIRIVGGLSNSIGSGKTATAVWNVAGPAIGLVVTPSAGIRTLHKRDTANHRGVLTMPVFMPICL